MSGPTLCVYCRQHPAEPRWQPFCSKRCRLADLGRWLQGDYRVPGPAADHALILSETEKEDDHLR